MRSTSIVLFSGGKDMDEILRQAQAYFEYARNIRRDLHRHPELGFQEVRTAGIVAQELRHWGFEVTGGIAKTGVVGVLEGDQAGPVVLLRFDMDALPIQEETGAEYASQYPGVMHACGHDGHVAIGLTVARLLAQNRARLRGKVKMVFQPAEEGLGGAEAMVHEGVLENPTADFAFALHLWNDKPLGWVAAVPGPFMAGSDIVEIDVVGQGGHGALPQQTRDPVVAAAHVIVALQSIVSRNVAPLQAAVFSVTQVHGGEAHNVIPSIVQLRGTLRTFEREVRELVIERIRAITQGVAGGLGCEGIVRVHPLTPAVVNNEAAVRWVAKVAQSLLPNAQIDTSYRTMVSEDMAFFLEQVPGCYFMVGSANPERGLVYGHHHPKFDFDEEALVYGAALMSAVVLEGMKEV
jgi:amidohydrolase